ELPRIYGQLYSMLTVNKPLAGEKVALLEIYADKPIKKILAVTDSNGRFEFNDLPVELDVNFDQSDKKFINQVKGPSRLISSKVTGYKLYLKDLGKLSYGIQSEENIPLEPDGRLAGYVVDEEGNSVMASVYVDSIRADTKIVYKYKSGNSGGKSKGGYMPAFDKGLSYFEMTVPSGKSRKIIIEPKDKGTYYTEVYTQDIPLKSATTEDVHEFKVYRAQKRIKFRILAGKSSTGKLQLPSAPKPLANVAVTLDVPGQ